MRNFKPRQKRFQKTWVTCKHTHKQGGRGGRGSAKRRWVLKKKKKKRENCDQMLLSRSTVITSVTIGSGLQNVSSGQDSAAADAHLGKVCSSYSNNRPCHTAGGVKRRDAETPGIKVPRETGSAGDRRPGLIDYQEAGTGIWRSSVHYSYS